MGEGIKRLKGSGQEETGVGMRRGEWSGGEGSGQEETGVSRRRRE